jgi:hypothetical protein
VQATLTGENDDFFHQRNILARTLFSAPVTARTFAHLLWISLLAIFSSITDAFDLYRYFIHA